MYAILTGRKAVRALIPDFDPIFPGVPIENRYPADFLENAIHIPDDTAVDQHWVYQPEAGTFSPPPEPAPVEPEPAPVEPESVPVEPESTLEQVINTLLGV